MQAYHVGTTEFQNSQGIRLPTVFGWVSQRLKHYRTKQATERHIANLRTLDQHFLEDIGVDMAVLGEAHVSQVGFVPTTSTACQVTNFFHLPVNMSTR